MFSITRITLAAVLLGAAPAAAQDEPSLDADDQPGLTERQTQSLIVR